MSFLARNILNCGKMESSVFSLISRGIASTEAKPELLNRNMSFRPAFDSHLEKTERPIAVVFSWLAAKSKHIYKYGDFYLKKGFDVLHVKIHLDQLMWPNRAQGVISEVLEFVGRRDKQPILVHGFSVGGYLYGECLVKITTEPDAYGAIGPRIVGQVFDSPVDVEGVPRGLGQALTDSRLLQRSITGVAHLYLGLFPRAVVTPYNRSSAAFHRNPLNTPSLMLYSSVDPIGVPGPIEQVMAGWRSRGVKVTSHCWTDTKHVSHFLRHPVQYITLLNDFLGDVGLVAGEDSVARATLVN